jgi:hypothetical protein
LERRPVGVNVRNNQAFHDSRVLLSGRDLIEFRSTRVKARNGADEIRMVLGVRKSKPPNSAARSKNSATALRIAP